MGQNDTVAEGDGYFLYFFPYLTDEVKREKINEIIDREEGIAMAVKTLGTFTQSELDYMRESSLLKGELDWQCDMTEARREARSEVRSDIAQKMKNAGRPLSEIMEFTGLPMETIAQL